MEEASHFTTKFKYVENAGKSLISILGTSDPWNTSCNRERCFPCQTEKDKCMKQGCNYTITCIICQENGNIVQYFGESAHTPWDRDLEHISALMNRNPESPLV